MECKGYFESFFFGGFGVGGGVGRGLGRGAPGMGGGQGGLGVGEGVGSAPTGWALLHTEAAPKAATPATAPRSLRKRRRVQISTDILGIVTLGVKFSIAQAAFWLVSFSRASALLEQ